MKKFISFFAAMALCHNALVAVSYNDNCWPTYDGGAMSKVYNIGGSQSGPNLPGNGGVTWASVAGDPGDKIIPVLVTDNGQFSVEFKVGGVSIGTISSPNDEIYFSPGIGNGEDYKIYLEYIGSENGEDKYDVFLTQLNSNTSENISGLCEDGNEDWYDPDKYVEDLKPEDEDCHTCGKCIPGGEEGTKASANSIEYEINAGSLNWGKHDMGLKFSRDLPPLGEAYSWFKFVADEDAPDGYYGFAVDFGVYGMGESYVSRIEGDNALVLLDYDIVYDGGNLIKNEVVISYCLPGQTVDDEDKERYAVFRVYQPDDGQGNLDENSLYIEERRYMPNGMGPPFTANPNSIKYYYYTYSPGTSTWTLMVGYEGSGADGFDPSNPVLLS